MIAQADLCRMCLAVVETVAPNVHSYLLTDLASESDYVVRIMVSTVAGSTNGTDCNFRTIKYGKSFLLSLST